MDVRRKRLKRKSANKPLCKYGSTCYRKNPEHTENFLHPEHDDSKKESPAPDNHTNNTRQNLQKDFDDGIDPKEDLLRLIKAYKNSQQEDFELPVIPKVQTTQGQSEPLAEDNHTNGTRQNLQKDSQKRKDPKDDILQLINACKNYQQDDSKLPVIPTVQKTLGQSEPLAEAQPLTDEQKQYVICEFLGNTVNKKSGETVKDVLKLMPPDFFDFWKFCSTINKAKPEDAFAEIGFHLVGIYDLLAKKIPETKIMYLHCHWRYYYDPPEFETVIKLDGSDLFHIGYFRDDPSEVPAIVASNSAKLGAKLSLMGDNVFAAMNSSLSKKLNQIKGKTLKEKFLKIQRDLQAFAKKRKYSLLAATAKTKARQKKVVAKTFHSLGIVVPIVRDVGYRCLSETDASLKKVLNQIVNAKDEKTKEENEVILCHVITNVNLANDECDVGAGLELGIDLFCNGDPYFHPNVLLFLPLAYCLLRREKFGEIVHAHIKNRKTGDNLADADI